jgi:hypothetical protein
MTHTNLRKTLIATALIGGALVGTSARADPIDVDEVVSQSYYLAQDTVTHRCIVVDVKPTADGVPTLAYESRALAERAIAEANVYDILDCSNAAMSADGLDGETTLPTEAADSAAFEPWAIAPTSLPTVTEDSVSFEEWAIASTP